MASTVVDPERVARSNDAPLRSDGTYVLYWMERAQRAEGNPALEHAIRTANALGLPVLVTVVLSHAEPDLNPRHAAYMVAGLADVATGLRRRGVAFAPRLGDPPDVVLRLARDAAMVVCDRGYLRHQRAWHRLVADASPVRVERVEADVVVPADAADDGRAYAARTFRPKLWRQVPRFLRELAPTTAGRREPDLTPGDPLASFDPRDVAGTLARWGVHGPVPPVRDARSGTRAGKRALRRFVQERLGRYADDRNQPSRDGPSGLSAALRYGHLSPVTVALWAREAAPDGATLDAFLEQLITRRELAVNFVLHAEADYDRYTSLPRWARATLDVHRGDARPALPDDAALENAETDDPYWNAAMREMRATGYMHGHMRMYWGKRILAWSRTPEEGFARTLALNDRWFLDGRDPNGVANVAWCYGLHDRPWPERPIYGTVRTMTPAGLRRKTDADAYVRKVARLAGGDGAGTGPWT